MFMRTFDEHILMHILNVRIFMHIFNVHIFMHTSDVLIFMHILYVLIFIHMSDVCIVIHKSDVLVSMHMLDVLIFMQCQPGNIRPCQGALPHLAWMSTVMSLVKNCWGALGHQSLDGDGSLRNGRARSRPSEQIVSCSSLLFCQ